LAELSEIGFKKSACVKRLTPGALAICENTIATSLAAALSKLPIVRRKIQ
jgi:hypothetical protein